MTNILKLYCRNRPLFLSLLRAKEAELYQQQLPFKKPVLDFGCGDGFFAKTVFKKIDAGLDVEDSRIEQTKGLGVYKSIVVYDGRDIPFPDRYFSTVVSNCVLEHLPDLKKTLQETYRVLKPGGKVIVTVMTDNWEKYLWGGKMFGEIYSSWFRRKQVHLNLLSVKEWGKIFIKSGFKVEHAQGYMGKEGSVLMEVTHYFSLPYLLNYLIFKKWVLLPIIPFFLAKFLYDHFFNKPVALEKGSAVFFVLWKK